MTPKMNSKWFTCDIHVRLDIHKQTWDRITKFITWLSFIWPYRTYRKKMETTRSSHNSTLRRSQLWLNSDLLRNHNTFSYTKLWTYHNFDLLNPFGVAFFWFIIHSCILESKRKIPYRVLSRICISFPKPKGSLTSQINRSMDPGTNSSLAFPLC